MLRLGCSKQSGFRLRVAAQKHRHFHSTPIVRHDSYTDTYTWAVSHLPAIHNLFQHIHEYTSLPWLVSIPLATVVVRSLIAPARYYCAASRRDQRRAEPELRMALMIAQKQIKMRSEAGTITTEHESGPEIMTILDWNDRKAEIEKEYPLLKPQPFVNGASNRDTTDMGTYLLTGINTISITSLSCNDPTLFQLGAIENLHTPIALCFAMLAISNSNYYSDYPLSRLDGIRDDKRQQPSIWNIAKWTPQEATITGLVLVPLFTAFHIWLLPTAVALTCFSSSMYTWLERRFINSWLKMPDAPQGHLAKGAMQSTKVRFRWPSSKPT